MEKCVFHVVCYVKKRKIVYINSNMGLEIFFEFKKWVEIPKVTFYVNLLTYHTVYLFRYNTFLNNFVLWPFKKFGHFFPLLMYDI